MISLFKIIVEIEQSKTMISRYVQKNLQFVMEQNYVEDEIVLVKMCKFKKLMLIYQNTEN